MKQTNKQHRALIIRMKLLLIMLLAMSSNFVFSQKDLTSPVIIDRVFDQNGTEYKLSDITVKKSANSAAARTVSVNCSSTSIFNLYFETGSGMEDTSNATHNARRAVVCKVFEDISNFLNTPLTANGNKVNIVVRDFTNENVPAGTLALASSFFIAPANPANTTSGVLDGEIWKTIHLGVDSYTNLPNYGNAMYHGRVSINFNDPAIQWHTDLTTDAPGSKYDLYTTVLHEVTHALGMHSFIDQNGGSLTSSKYYSRYDTFLKTNGNVPLLLVGNCSMYELSFNSANVCLLQC
ncbi:MAG: hypothetical protein QM710_05390 [Flavobacterium sp.]